MNIQVNENGNFAFISNNEIKLITSSFNIHQHPNDKNAILFNDKFEPTEEGSLSVQFDKLTINGKKPQVENIFQLKGVLFNDIPLKQGQQPSLDRENDPNYIIFRLQTTYEAMLNFIESNAHKDYPQLKYNDGKLVQKEYYCDFQTFSIRVTLNYYYLANNQISHILMSGNVEKVALPVKAYHYSDNGNTHHTYEVFYWQRNA